jgi:hypothetical protein
MVREVVGRRRSFCCLSKFLVFVESMREEDKREHLERQYLLFTQPSAQQSRLLPLQSAMPPINKRSASPDGLDAGRTGREKTRKQQKLIRW